MNELHAAGISSETGLKRENVAAVIRLLDDGATVPFIARYRKEATGSLDEVSIIQVRDRIGQLRKLEERRSAILRSMEERKVLTDELRRRIRSAGSITLLEDIYLPFRPKRRTRASRARERGLEPLARRILLQEGGDPGSYASSFVDPEKDVGSVEDALSGASDIVAEILTEDPSARESMRKLYWNRGTYRSKLVPKMEAEAGKFRDYFDWEEPVRKTPSHRVLAMRRGEKQKCLSLKILVDEEEALDIVLAGVCRDRESPEGAFITEAARDGFRRLLGPSMETETRLRSREAADDEAIRVFISNLRSLLLAPPLGRKAVTAIDPGYRTGCKVVCLSCDGTVLQHATVHPFGSEQARREAARTVARLVEKHGTEFVAVGNGTAGRETESFLESVGLPGRVRVVTVSESGASVYSASQVAREEFPDLDVTMRGAVSIGRRLQDPLAELVKIDPRSIGVGQYQHDVDGGKLRRALDDTVASCVNSVGVDVNTASVQLLSYVSGLSARIAGRIVSRRSEEGPFSSRQQLMSVRGLGPAAFQQSAGFLRIRDGANPLDSSGVHPESYHVVERMAASEGVGVRQLMASPEIRKSLDLREFMDDSTGLPTLEDIMEELDRPGRDPRDSFKVFRFADVHGIGDLEEGMVLPGVVTNVTNFGAFVDVGVHQDGLVHVSRMSEEYVRDPAELVSAGDRVRVRVLSVDIPRGRISLSMTFGDD
ncbi:MAG: Tex family protein [Candidatus Aegiribacteria sp.]